MGPTPTASAPAMKDDKFYKPLVPYLTKINNECIAMEENDTKRSVEVTLKVLEELIKKMKEANSMFGWMFNRLTYVGSYFDGLRVKEATEFDINVVLKLPLVYEKMVVKRDHKHPGFVKVNVKNAKYPEAKLKFHEKETEEIFAWWANAEGDLSHLKVLRWWESIFSKLNGLSELTVDGRVFKITNFKKAGPAMTAHISDSSYGIDVDLVPVIEFPDTIPPPQPIRRESGVWYIVPKRIDANEYIWRLSFPPQERAIMNGKNSLKMVNRFLKRIRDVLNWKPVSSYYIKTMFLWEASIQKDATFFGKNLGFLLIYFLGKWVNYMEQKKLPFFWDKEMNLFEKIKDVTMENYASQLKRLRDQIEKYLLQDKPDELSQLLTKLFEPNGGISVAKPRGKSEKPAPNVSDDSNLSLSLLIDFDSTEEQNSYSSADLPQDLFAPLEPTPVPESSDLFNIALDLVKSSVHQVNSPINHVPSSAITSVAISADGGYGSATPVTSPDSTQNEVSSSSSSNFQNQSDLLTAKEKSTLEIEECKLRLRIAELDLETAKYNLKTAEKRFEMVSLQFNSLMKADNCEMQS